MTRPNDTELALKTRRLLLLGNLHTQAWDAIQSDQRSVLFIDQLLLAGQYFKQKTPFVAMALGEAGKLYWEPVKAARLTGEQILEACAWYNVPVQNIAALKIGVMVLSHGDKPVGSLRNIAGKQVVVLFTRQEEEDDYFYYTDPPHIVF
ncbi:MAG: hypothetical protein KW788_04510 [Candidatus Doudnabacteria bacterium]|nr:hypothetical protein [Candidatus Doudnabacteria bacterium]